MITLRELREISLDFRRCSSNFLNSTTEDADILIRRFKNYIDSTPFISDVIKKKTEKIEFDYNDCFLDEERHGYGEIHIPVDEACHIKAMYDFLGEMANNSSKDVLDYSVSFNYSSSKYDEIIQDFLSVAFKPLIDFIIDSISKEMILVEEESKASANPTISQHIDAVYGTVNQQGSGTIVSVTTVNPEIADISARLDKIIDSLDYIENVSEDDIENVKDDLESIKEQIESSSPKKNRLQKAIANIKTFVKDLSMKLAVSYAAGVITETDWVSLIQDIEAFIASVS